MATSKKRLNITLSPDTEKAISKLAGRDNVPEATKAAELLRIAIEIEEDFLLNKVATERYKNSQGTVSHEEFWK